MGRELSKDKLISHKEEVISKLSSYLDSLIETDSSALNGKADKLCFWLKDWTTFFEI